MRLLASAALALACALAVGISTGAVPTEPPTKAAPQVDRRQQWLIQAGLELTPRQFWAASAGIGLAGLFLFFLVTGVFTVALAPAVLAFLAPRIYFGRVREKRLAEVQRAWPDGLRDLVSSIGAGMSLPRAIEALTRSGPEPLRRAFARFPYLSKTLGVEAALEVVKEELADPTSDRVIEVLILAHERGGTVVPEILRDLADATSRDVWTLEEISTQALEQKINARAVFALPWLVLVAITARQGAFRDFYSSAGGMLVVMVGAVMSGAGLFLVGRLSRDPDEPRVFGGAAARSER